MRFGDVGEARETLGEVAVLVRLHQTEMALGQDEVGVTRDRTEDGNLEPPDGVSYELPMPLAAETIEHDAADPHLRIVRDEPARYRRRRLRLSRNVDDEQNRQSKRRGEVGRGPGPEPCAGDAVEQAHGALDDEKIGIRSTLSHQRIDQRRRHGPTVEIEAWPPRRRLVEGRIDIVGARLCRLHRQPAGGEAPQALRA